MDATITPPPRRMPVSRRRSLRHTAEMLVVMGAGMALGPMAFWSAVGTDVDEALSRHGIAFMLVMASSMTVPMVAWMRYRGHAWRRTTEMGLVMLAPAVPLALLEVCDVIGGPVCGAYCLASVAAMAALLVVRRNDYFGQRTASV